MKTLIASLLLFSGVAAHAAETKCQVLTIHNSTYLGKNLSREEHPNVILRTEEITIGAFVYSEANGDFIQWRPTVGFDKAVEIMPSDSEQKLLVTVTGHQMNRIGTIWGQNKGEERAKIADLKCR